MQCLAKFVWLIVQVESDKGFPVDNYVAFCLSKTRVAQSEEVPASACTLVSFMVRSQAIQSFLPSKVDKLAPDSSGKEYTLT